MGNCYTKHNQNTDPETKYRETKNILIKSKFIRPQNSKSGRTYSRFNCTEVKRIFQSCTFYPKISKQIRSIPHKLTSKQNNQHCQSYSIQYAERCGRMLIAEDDITAGEVLFTDKPLAVGPDNDSQPVCLACHKSLPGLVYRCRYCSWPLCSHACQQNIGHHERECQLFRMNSARFVEEDYKKSYIGYNAIMLLRILWLKDNYEDAWKLLDKMMDHLEHQIVKDTNTKSVIDFIHNHCKLTQFTEQELYHIMGVLNTNAYIVGENPDKDVHLQGLFPTASILNHSCSANTICFPRENYEFTCRAVRNINKGEELTSNYLHCRYHFYSASYRKKQLADIWHFDCHCNRCLDSLDFGTMLDAMRCKECQDGKIKQMDGNTVNAWICSNCYDHQSAKDVGDTLDYWWNVINQTSKYDIKLLSELLLNLEEVFHEDHFYILEVKWRIIENIGETNGNYYEHLAEDWLEKKVEFCRDHLKIQERIAPGLSKYRAYLSAHIAEPLYWLNKKKYSQQNSNEKDLIEDMEEVAQHLLMVIKIWGPYRPGSEERLKAEIARDQLEMVDNMYLNQQLCLVADDILRTL